MRAVSQEIPQPLATNVSFKITHLKFTLNLPGANELTQCPLALDFEYIWGIGVLSISSGIFLRQITHDLLDINSLWPSDAIWVHLSGSTLAQVMACCLTAPSHYLNQCWLIFSKVQWHPLEGNCTKIAQPLITKIILKINNIKFH